MELTNTLGTLVRFPDPPISTLARTQVDQERELLARPQMRQAAAVGVSLSETGLQLSGLSQAAVSLSGFTAFDAASSSASTLNTFVSALNQGMRLGQSTSYGQRLSLAENIAGLASSSLTSNNQSLMGLSDIGINYASSDQTFRFDAQRYASAVSGNASQTQELIRNAASQALGFINENLSVQSPLSNTYGDLRSRQLQGLEAQGNLDKLMSQRLTDTIATMAENLASERQMTATSFAAVNEYQSMSEIFSGLDAMNERLAQMREADLAEAAKNTASESLGSDKERSTTSVRTSASAMGQTMATPAVPVSSSTLAEPRAPVTPPVRIDVSA